tara:strand:- start:145 stop:366 length:222 start_codon:yes stop_codon:yes gene_type:complete
MSEVSLSAMFEIVFCPGVSLCPGLGKIFTDPPGQSLSGFNPGAPELLLDVLNWPSATASFFTVPDQVLGINQE